MCDDHFIRVEGAAGGLCCILDGVMLQQWSVVTSECFLEDVVSCLVLNLLKVEGD